MPPTNFIDGLMGGSSGMGQNAATATGGPSRWTPPQVYQPNRSVPGAGMPPPPTGMPPATGTGGHGTPMPGGMPMPGSAPQGPPPGFTTQQWSQLQALAKKNPSIAALMKQYSTAANTPDPAWRRQQPTDNTQLARQLSYNAGELGMPGSRTGALQLPAFGSNAQAVNNPDMSTYGQTPGLGEATFYTQSMKGGMAPIAAMAPFGVPEGWNPGGTQTDALKKQLMEAFTGSGGSGGAPVHDAAWAKMYMKNQARSMGFGALPNPMATMEAMQLLGGGGGPDFGQGGSGGPDMHTNGGSGQKPATPMQFPYGF